MTDAASSAPALTPTEELILDVLGARHRLGEHLWTFPTRVRPSVRRLHGRGLVEWKCGVVDATILVWLTPQGQSVAISPNYQAPALTLELWGVQSRRKPRGEWGAVDTGADMHRGGGYSRAEALQEVEALQFNAERRDPHAGVMARLVRCEASQWAPA